MGYAQEKPEREEQPDRAPVGIVVPLAGWPLVAERIFLMFALLQCLQRMLSMAEAMSTRLSNVWLQSSHLNSYIGIFVPLVIVKQQNKDRRGLTCSREVFFWFAAKYNLSFLYFVKVSLPEKNGRQ